MARRKNILYYNDLSDNENPQPVMQEIALLQREHKNLVIDPSNNYNWLNCVVQFAAECSPQSHGPRGTSRVLDARLDQSHTREGERMLVRELSGHCLILRGVFGLIACLFLTACGSDSGLQVPKKTSSQTEKMVVHVFGSLDGTLSDALDRNAEIIPYESNNNWQGPLFINGSDISSSEKAIAAAKEADENDRPVCLLDPSATDLAALLKNTGVQENYGTGEEDIEAACLLKKRPGDSSSPYGLSTFFKPALESRTAKEQAKSRDVRILAVLSGINPEESATRSAKAAEPAHIASDGITLEVSDIISKLGGGIGKTFPAQVPKISPQDTLTAAVNSETGEEYQVWKSATYETDEWTLDVYPFVIWEPSGNLYFLLNISPKLDPSTGYYEFYDANSQNGELYGQNYVTGYTISINANSAQNAAHGITAPIDSSSLYTEADWMAPPTTTTTISSTFRHAFAEGVVVRPSISKGGISLSFAEGLTVTDSHTIGWASNGNQLSLQSAKSPNLAWAMTFNCPQEGFTGDTGKKYTPTAQQTASLTDPANLQVLWQVRGDDLKKQIMSAKGLWMDVTLTVNLATAGMLEGYDTIKRCTDVSQAFCFAHIARSMAELLHSYEPNCSGCSSMELIAYGEEASSSCNPPPALDKNNFGNFNRCLPAFDKCWQAGYANLSFRSELYWNLAESTQEANQFPYGEGYMMLADPSVLTHTFTVQFTATESQDPQQCGTLPHGPKDDLTAVDIIAYCGFLLVPVLALLTLRKRRMTKSSS